MRLCVALYLALCCPAASSAAETETLVNTGAFGLADGEAKELTFDSRAQPHLLLWVQARIDLTQGEAFGCHALKLSLDGKALTPAGATALNKKQVVEETVSDGAEAQPVSKPFPLFDAETGAWFLKADSDWTAYNSGTDGGPHCRPELSGCAGRMGSAIFSHYYEYLLKLPALPGGRHLLSISARLPKDSPARSLAFRTVRLVETDAQFLLSIRNWMEMVFPWQAPRADALLDGRLRLRACGGEYEAATFSVFGLSALSALDVKLSDLKHAEGKAGMPAENVEALAIKEREWEGIFRGVPAVPEGRADQTPELLVPLAEEKPDLPALHSQRFYLDVHVPQDARPGRYHGTVQVLSAGQRLADIPLELEVLPFKLAPARQKYWMWRMHWGPIWESGNVACLRNIKAHGYHGLTRTCGAGFRFRVSKDGRVEVDGSEYRKLARVFREVGLELRLSDDHIAHGLVGAAAKHLGIKLPTSDLRKDIPALRRCVELEFTLRKATEAKNELIGADKLELGEEDPELDPDEVALEDGPKPGEEERRKREEAVERRYQELKAKLDALVISGFTQVKRLCQELGLTLYVFPVDEPCGTPWRRAWTSFAAGLAKRAGLETWSTRNNFDWAANIDHNAMGGGINAMYQEGEQLLASAYEGELTFSALPMIGAFRGGTKYHFDGLIDEVRIYSRALSAEEIMAQHKTPAKGDLILYYSFDGEDEDTGQIVDRSGKGHHGKIAGRPTLVPGKVGKALHLNGEDEHLIPIGSGPDGEKIDLTKGWSISLWFRGQRSLFGWGYGFYHEPGGIRFLTSTKDSWFPLRFAGTRHGWGHLTVSFDPTTRTVKGFVENREIRRWFRRNVRWNYMQIRSTWSGWPRHKTGIMSWHYGNYGSLRNITTFSYDLSTTNYTAYPKGGDRFNKEGVWYRTPGLEGAREGIDDARYLQTLVETLKAKAGLNERAAVRAVSELIAPVDGSYKSMGKVLTAFGSHDQLRQRVIGEIMKHQGE